MTSTARRGDEPAWYVVDVPGLSCPANLLQGPAGWRVRLCAAETELGGCFAFCGEASMAEPVLGVTFGEFQSSGSAMEFVSGVSIAVSGAVADLSGRVRQALPDEEPDAVSRDFFFLLEKGADPVTGSRAAVVLLFDLESPSFDGDVESAIVSAKSVPVRPDPAPAAFYERSAPQVPAALAAAGGIGAVLSMVPDETLRYERKVSGATGEDLEVDPDVDDGNWPVPGPVDVRPMGVLSREMGESVARVASPMSSKGSMKLKVDESVDSGVRDDGVMRRSYSVFTVIRAGDLQNARLRSALTGILREEATKQRVVS